ncbi:DUF3515 domain-containing protein [Streptomyces sp. NA04227]|uniref:DUF3515 domain-containing protein n=1 Tax=Streptomyces sp. NA04227 TaxID=2742136 RepID=UPI0015916F82|nr:DUF3515 domain-containing protein [Streptomyces sp. NA04227]QKW09421.1 DUF3515 domain-containing protein [Streptomyces sp. NA04227]
MNFSISGRRALGAPPVLALLLTATAACTSGDGGTDVAVPEPGAESVRLCRDLDRELPDRVAGQRREDPAASQLTAAWGDPAYVLRCGVTRPDKMDDPKADGVDVDGVGWLLEKRSDGSFRFTTTLRKAYVEVTVPEDRASEGLAPLTDLAPPVKKTIPKGVSSD